MRRSRAEVGFNEKRSFSAHHAAEPREKGFRYVTALCFNHRDMTMDGFTYRTADISDVAALVPLINRAFEVERPFFTTERIDLAETLEHFRKGTFILVEDGNTMAGCNYVELRGDSGYFGLLAIDPKYQGRGLGRKLTEQAEDLCRRAGCRRMQIRVLNHRTELPPFYGKLGYHVAGTEEVEQVPTDRQQPGGKLDSSYCYRKKELSLCRITCKCTKSSNDLFLAGNL